jgi:ABC-type multidrug transport system fused ATPase/permease subunit
LSINNQHPVWLVHDEFKTARFNLYIYQYQIGTLKLWKIIFDIIAAVSTSSVVAGLWFWETSIGNVAWKAIGTLAAIMVVIVPILNISDRIKQKSELYSGWRLIDDGFNKLEISIREQDQYNDEMKKRFHQLLDMESDIKQKEGPETPSLKLRIKCQEQVNIELPAESFIVPEEK